MSTSATITRERLNPLELHQLRWLLGLGLALLGYWALFSIDVGNFFALLLSVLIVSVCLVFPELPGKLPEWCWKLAVPLILTFIILDFINSGADILPPLARMVIVLSLYRCLQYRRRREDLQLALMCLFMTVMSGVLTGSISFAVQIMLFCVAAMALLFVLVLIEPEAGRALSREEWESFRWKRFIGKLWRVMDGRLLSFWALLFTAMVGVSALIFVSIPRFQIDQSFGLPHMKGTTGFSEIVDYNKRSFEQDTSVALRVDVPQGFVFNSTPYWRMVVMDEYRYNTFHVSDGLQPLKFFKVPRYTPDPRLHLADAPRQPGRWRFYLEGNESKFLPIIGPFDTLTLNNPQLFSGNSTMQIFRFQDTPSSVVGYEIEGMDIGDALPASAEEIRYFATKKTPASRGYPGDTLLLPENPEDAAFISQTAAEICGGNTALDMPAFSKLAIAYLHKGHGTADTVTYTSPPRGRDALVAWMKSGSNGWCEYFAGSFVLLARAAGYPARLVAGYKGAIYNDIENYYVVKKSYAHAWAEVYDGNGRWLRLDPTENPADTITGMPTSAELMITAEHGWGARFDSLRMLWYRRVINFDQTDQQEIADKIGFYATDIAKKFREVIIHESEMTATWGEKILNGNGIAVICLIAAVMMLLIRMRSLPERLWMRFGGRGLLAWAGHSQPVRRSAGRWLQRFEPLGSTHASRMLPDMRARWLGIHGQLLALRYGPPDVIGDPVRTFNDAREFLRLARKARV